MSVLKFSIVWLLRVSVCTSLLFTTVTASAQANPVVNQSDEWVVVLKDPRPARLSGFNVKSYSAKHYANSPVLKRYGKRVSRDYQLDLKKAWFIESINVYCLIVDIKGSDSDTLASLRADKRVEWVQKSNNFSLLGADIKRVKTDIVQEQISDQHLSNPKATGAGIQIALIDSAVADKHPDLIASIVESHDLVVGSSGSEETAIKSATSGERHGTAMAGVIVASPSNDLGLIGVAPEADVFAYRGCWELASGDTQCNTLSLARALDGVAKSDAVILNLSLSGPEDRLLDRLIDRLVEKGVFIVAAFDPSRPEESRFPSRRDGVLIVRAEHMHQNYTNEFTAPGKRIVVSPNTGYFLMTGHSVATAYTTGVLALLVEKKALQQKVLKNQSVNTELASIDLLKQKLSRDDVSKVEDLLKMTF